MAPEANRQRAGSPTCLPQGANATVCWEAGRGYSFAWQQPRQVRLPPRQPPVSGRLVLVPPSGLGCVTGATLQGLRERASGAARARATAALCRRSARGRQPEPALRCRAAGTETHLVAILEDALSPCSLRSGLNLGPERKATLHITEAYPLGMAHGAVEKTSRVRRHSACHI